MIGEYQRPVFALEERGFGVRAYYRGNEQNALIVVTRDGGPFRQFLYPAYRIWNINAHFSDMVDDFLDAVEAGKEQS